MHSKAWAYHSSKALPSTSTGDIPGSLEPTRMFATVQLVESSWDLMPPDVVRPLAKTNVGSLITMSGRLGMHWITFAPERGVLSAQGNGHSISSTVITGLGILCEYRGDQSKYRDLFAHGASSMLAASSESDMLRCGIIPPSMYFGRAIPLVGDGSDQIVMEKFLSKVGIDLDLRLQLLTMVDKPVLRETHDYLSLVLAESIGVMAPFMVMEGEEKCHVQWPSVRRWTYCITNCWEGRAALAYKLGSRLKQESNATLQRILNGLNRHEKMLPVHFSGWMDSISTWEDKDDGILNKFEMLNFLREEHSWATASLHHLATPTVQGRPISIESHFMRYLSWHLNMSIRSLDKIEEAKRDYPFVSQGDKAKPSTVKHMLELGMRYVEAVDRELTVTEAVQWWLMIYRSFCWYASVNIEYTYGPLPSSYFESRLPVYLG